MAPPITVDIMVVLLGCKAIARAGEQQARARHRGSHARARFTGSQEADSFALARRNAFEGTKWSKFR
jgi:hypothetical protein